MNTKITNTKIVATGSIIEAFEYLDRSVAYNFDDLRTENSRIEKEHSPEEKAEIRRRSMLQSSIQAQRLINSNVWQYSSGSGQRFLPVFSTFTFSDDVRDIKVANYIFSKFIKRLNFFINSEKRSNLKYINVIEFQDKNRDGVVHYHTLFFNLPYVWKKQMETIWDQGFIKIKKVDKVKNLGRYLTKYMTKNFADPRLDNQKRYFTSKGLIKPSVIRNEKDARLILERLPKDLGRSEEYVSKYCGKVRKTVFELERGQSIVNLGSYDES